MDRSSYDRFSSREPESGPEYNEDAFEDGEQARRDGRGLNACPDGDNQFMESWRAGWMAADSSISAEMSGEG